MTTTAPGGGDNDPPCHNEHVDNSIESICNDRSSPILEVDENSSPSMPLPNKRKDSFLQKLRRRFSISAGSKRKTSLDSNLPSGSYSSSNRKVSAGIINSSKNHESGSRKISFFRHSFKLSSRKSASQKGNSEVSSDDSKKWNADVGSPAEGSSDPIPVASSAETNPVRVHVQVDSTVAGSAEINGSSVGSSAIPQQIQPAKPFVPTPEFIQQLTDLFNYPWYWGPLTSSEATTLLETQVDGAFLIRDSEKDVNRVSLSFKSGGRTLHCRIEYQDGLFRFFEGEGFSTIPELIENAISKSRDSIYCYSRSPNSDSTSYSVRLTSPILRTVEPRTLQYLCRFRIRRFARAEKARLPIPPHLKPWLESRNLRF